MRVKLDNPALTADLVAALSARVDAIVSLTGEDELEVSLLGSRATAADTRELQRRLHAWGKGARVVDDEAAS